MINILEIISCNEETFYDFSKGKEARTSSGQFRKFALAFLFALLFTNLSRDFLNIVLSIYAILTGFGFNTLFYLLNFQREIDTDSLEKQTVLEKINVLSKELFFNVAYFNILSVMLILLCLIYHVYSSFDNELVLEIMKEQGKKLPTSALNFLQGIWNYTKFSYYVLFYYCLIESLFTFVRITARTFFMFRRVLS